MCMTHTKNELSTLNGNAIYESWLLMRLMIMQLKVIIEVDAPKCN